MKKQVTKGVVVGAIIAMIAVVGISIFYPTYTCLEVPANQPTNCHRIIDLTPTLTVEIFLILMIVGGGIGWITGRKLAGSTTK